jgi:TPR repeat protein
LYREGQGVDQNYERAAEYYEAAALQGCAVAQNNLGVLYMYKVKVSSNQMKRHGSGG